MPPMWPARRPWLFASPSDSACSEAEGSTDFGAWVVGMACSLTSCCCRGAVARACMRGENPRRGEFSHRVVIPGRCEASNPESRGYAARDSGFSLREPRNDALRASARAEEIALADLDAVVAQNAVRGHGVKVEVREREPAEE